jgi:hypothetical protein
MELILLLITGFLILKVVRIFSSADKRLALSCGLLQFCYNPFVTMRPYAGSNSNSIFIPELSILSRDVFCFHLMILACVCVCTFTVTAEAMFLRSDVL